nr:uncharacterized protein LOC105174450 [Ipomoea batatas]
MEFWMATKFVSCFHQLLGMQDQRMVLPEETLVPKSRKKKASAQKTSISQTQGDNLSRMQDTHFTSIQVGKKASKRGQEVDASTSGDDYRALRRKYLLLEEESFTLGKELMEVEDGIKALEEEKLGLLDELVVLEGLVDPSEIQSHGQRLQ